MNLRIHTVQGSEAGLEIDASETVDALRKKISELLSYPPGASVLILCQGKIIMQTKEAISSVEAISDGAHLVVMKRTAPRPTGAPPAAENAPTPAAVPVEDHVVKAVPPSQPTEPVAAPAAPAAAVASEVQPAAETAQATEDSGAGDGGILLGARAEAALDQLVQMGFPREDAARAMRAAFNNLDRACEYLLTGIPEIPDDAPMAEQQAAAHSVPDQTANEGETNPEMGAQGPVSAVGLTEEPMPGMQLSADGTNAAVEGLARQLRQLTGGDPASFPSALNEIVSQNPDLMRLINLDPERFARLLNQSGQGQQAQQAEQIQITLTPEEAAAVERLGSLGFDPQDALQAYLACDKDENAAANLLFEHSE